MRMSLPQPKKREIFKHIPISFGRLLTTYSKRNQVIYNPIVLVGYSPGNRLVGFSTRKNKYFNCVKASTISPYQCTQHGILSIRDIGIFQNKCATIISKKRTSIKSKRIDVTYTSFCRIHEKNAVKKHGSFPSTTL